MAFRANVMAARGHSQSDLPCCAYSLLWWRLCARRAWSPGVKRLLVQHFVGHSAVLSTLPVPCLCLGGAKCDRGLAKRRHRQIVGWPVVNTIETTPGFACASFRVAPVAFRCPRAQARPQYYGFCAPRIAALMGALLRHPGHGSDAFFTIAWA